MSRRVERQSPVYIQAPVMEADRCRWFLSSIAARRLPILSSSSDEDADDVGDNSGCGNFGCSGSRQRWLLAAP